MVGKEKTVALLLSAALLFSLTSCKTETEQQQTGEPEKINTVQPEETVQQDTAEEPPAPEIEELKQVEEVVPVEADPVEAPVDVEAGGADDLEAVVEEIDNFTDVDETVYATGTVNIRSGPGTSYEKVGQLKWSDSVHRIGIGTGDADGWSEVELSDGRIVYVSNQYLSVNKPVATQGNSGGQSTTQAPSTQTQQPTQQPQQPTQPSQPANGGSYSSKGVWIPSNTNPREQTGELIGQYREGEKLTDDDMREIMGQSGAH